MESRSLRHSYLIPALNSLIKHIILLLIVFLVTTEAFTQIFPEVNTTVGQEKSKESQYKEQEELGLYYYRNEEYEKAAPIFKELHKEKPNYSTYNYYMNCLLRLGEYEEAESFVRDQIKSRNNERYQVDLGYIYLMTNRSSKAQKHFETLISSLKPDKTSIINLASAFINRQQFDYTAKTYIRGRTLLNGTYNFHSELANIYEITGDYDLMIDEYLGLIDDDPSSMARVQGRLQNVLNKDEDNQISDALRTALLKKNQDDPDNILFAEMLYWHSIQKEDFAFALIQAKSFDRRFNEDGKRVFDLAQLSIANEDYKVAIEAFNYLIGKGEFNPFYHLARIGSLNARFLQITYSLNYSEDDLLDLEYDYLELIGEMGNSPSSLPLRRDYAKLRAYYFHDMPEAVRILEEAIHINGASPKERALCKIALADIYLVTGEVWESTLLYSQVDKDFQNDPIGHEATLRNARLSFYIGEFDWAKAQLDVLKAATTKLIANDAMELSLLISDNMDPDSGYAGLKYFSRAELYRVQNQDSLCLVTLDSIHTLGLWHPLFDEVLFAKAKIYLKNRDYNMADSLFSMVYTMYPEDILADNALLERGKINEEIFRDKIKAMEIYEKLLLDYPGSILTTEARRRFRALRGDNLTPEEKFFYDGAGKS